MIYASDIASLTLKDSSYISGVAASAAFTTAETWDCNAPSGATFTDIDFTTKVSAVPAAKADFDACDANLSFGWDWVDCPNG